MLGKLTGSTFLRQNGVFFVGSLVASFLNYLYYPVLGRMLHPAAFGETQALVSMILQVGIFLAVLGTLTINLMNSREESAARNRLILELEKFALFISVVLLFLTVIFSHVLQRFFRFEDWVPFIILGLAVCITVPFTFRSAYLRGKHQFGQASVAGIVGAGTKLLFSAILVKLGFGTTGAILGLVLAQIVSFIYAAVCARRAGFHESLMDNFIRLPDMKLILPELKYAGLILVCSLTITALYSVDIIAVKHYFDAHTAGLYAGVAAVARIVFFLTASITQVMMSHIKVKGEMPHNRQTLKKSFILLTALGGGATLVFWIAPNLILTRLMGGTYSVYASLLPRLSLALLSVSILNLFVNYHLALRRYAIALIAIIGAAATAAFLLINHGTLVAVVNSLLYGSVVMFLALGGWLGVANVRQQKELRLWRNS